MRKTDYEFLAYTFSNDSRSQSESEAGFVYEYAFEMGEDEIIKKVGEVGGNNFGGKGAG